MRMLLNLTSLASSTFSTISSNATATPLPPSSLMRLPLYHLYKSGLSCCQPRPSLHLPTHGTINQITNK
uniref:Uncharacterized protein n=1 Tax=Cucumis melo TaxID=3656 RepID=A0A9I9E2D9_CUCME